MYINPKVIFKNYCENKKVDNFFCTLCGLPHTSHEDFEKSKEWKGICHECYLTFIETRRKEWKDGWRPDKETLETYIYNRRNVLIVQEIK